jgi:DNA-binding GntR family transcriptional regulator
MSKFTFRPGEPMKKQVADDLRRRIAEGEFGVGDSMGDIYLMAEHYGSSVGVVRAAQVVLGVEGVLSEIRWGKPTRVIALPQEDSSDVTALIDRLRILNRDMKRECDARTAQMDMIIARFERGAS